MDGPLDDSGNRTAPPGVHGSNISARSMRDQDWHAIGCARCNREAVGTRDQCVALHVGHSFDDIGVANLTHLRPMHLPLLEQVIAIKPKALCKPRAVFTNRSVVITQMKTEVERIVRCDAHPARTCCECVTEAVPIQKGGMESTHHVLFSMARLREPPRRAKEPVPKPGQGVGCASISFRGVDRSVASRAEQ